MSYLVSQSIEFVIDNFGQSGLSKPVNLAFMIPKFRFNSGVLGRFK